MMSRIALALAALFLNCVSAHAGDVKSSANVINFDLNGDGSNEMQLTATGLGIGITPSANLQVAGNASITGSAYIGTTGGNETLNIAGSLGLAPQTVTLDATASNNTLILADTSSNNITLTLPDASSAKGRTYNIKKLSSSNSLFVSGNIDSFPGGLTFDGNINSMPLPAVSLYSDGSKYFINSLIGSGNNETLQVDSIQSASFTVGAGNLDHYINITDVGDLNKTVLLHSWTLGSVHAAESHLLGEMLNTSTLHFERQDSGNTISGRYYVIKFKSGVYVQRGNSVTVNGSLNVTINEVDLTKSFPLISTFSDTGTTTNQDDFVTGSLTNSTTLNLLDAASATVSWQVVQMQNTRVQSGSFSLRAATSTTASLNYGIDINKSFLIFSSNVDSNIYTSGNYAIEGKVTNSTTLTFTRNSLNRSIGGQYYLVEFLNNGQVRSGSQAVANGDTALNISIGTAVDTAKSFPIVCGQWYTGGSTNFNSDDSSGMDHYTLNLNSTTNLLATRTTTGSAGNINWFVIQLP